jgi:hypothetical protein
MGMEQSVEWELVGETEVLGENLPRCHFVHHNSHMTWSGIEPGLLLWEAATIRLSYDTGNTLSLWPSLNVRDQVSHPYRTTGKIIALCILIYTFTLYAVYENIICHVFHVSLSPVKKTVLYATSYCQGVKGRPLVYYPPVRHNSLVRVNLVTYFNGIIYPEYCEAVCDRIC